MSDKITNDVMTTIRAIKEYKDKCYGIISLSPLSYS